MASQHTEDGDEEFMEKARRASQQGYYLLPPDSIVPDILSVVEHEDEDHQRNDR
jgi:hypothetical protein